MSKKLICMLSKLNLSLKIRKKIIEYLSNLDLNNKADTRSFLAMSFKRFLRIAV